MLSFSSNPTSHSLPLVTFQHGDTGEEETSAMGRPPGNGGPAFRFTQSEVAEMEGILQEHNNRLPPRDLFVMLAEKFSNGSERFGKSTVHMKQVWNWFQNKRYALKAKSSKVPVPGKLDVEPLQSVPPAQAPPALHPMPPVRQEINGSPASNMLRSFAPPSGKALSSMDFEARSARDGAWYDVAAFLSVKNKDTDDPEVLVRFVGLTPEEDEWIKVSKHVRYRSLPCEAAECVAVLPGDLILCFQEAPEQALYFDAHVLDAQRMKHDLRACSCRFLVRYDHDQSEEVVSLRKICRRPETDYRLQIYQALRDLPAPRKNLTPIGGSISQAESENVDAIQQKMTAFPNTSAVLGNPTGSLELTNAVNKINDSASKSAHGHEEIMDADAATKKLRLSDEKENPESQTLNAHIELEAKKENDDVQDQGKEVTSAVSTDQNPIAASRGDGPEPENSGGVVLTCQNQTNGHNGGSSGSSDVPVGAQQCF